MKRLIIMILSVLMSMNVFSQDIEPGSLWKAEMIYDTLDNKYPDEKIQKFMYFDNENSISTLTIYEKMNMVSGEVVISYKIEANNLDKLSDYEYKVKELRVDYLKLIGQDSIYYKEEYYNIGFKKIDIEKSNLTQGELMDFLLSGSVRKYYEEGESLNQIHTYMESGKKAIQIVESHSSWESDFRVFSFEGYLFLKGITSAPMLIERLEDGKIYGKEADYRFDAKKFEIRKNNQDEEATGWKYLNGNDFKIKYPLDWQVDENGQMGTRFILFSPLSSESDNFKENVNLLVQDLTGYNLTLDQYVEVSESQIETLVTDGEVVLNERINDGDSEYQRVIYSGRQGAYDLKFEQFYWVINDKAYVLTLTCEDKEFDKYKEVGEEVLKSFEVK